jgi:hypothetical protein
MEGRTYIIFILLFPVNETIDKTFFIYFQEGCGNRMEAPALLREENRRSGCGLINIKSVQKIHYK